MVMMGFRWKQKHRMQQEEGKGNRKGTRRKEKMIDFTTCPVSAVQYTLTSVILFHLISCS